MRDVKQPRHQAAMWFDGVNDYVKIPNNSVWPVSFTIVARVYLSATTSNFRILSARPSACYFELFVNAQLPQPKVSFFNGSLYPAGLITINRNQWYIIGATISNNNIVRYYVDGQFDSQWTLPITWKAYPFHVGRVSSFYSSGSLRNLRVYSRVLTDIEMLAPFQITDSIFIDIVGNGNTAAAWQDLSGGGNHGTVYGSPEQCLIHRRGAVIRTDANNQRYIVT